MIQNGSLSAGNLDHLAEMLQEVHRRDLAEKVRKFHSEGMCLEKIMLLLSEGKDDKNKIKITLVCSCALAWLPWSRKNLGKAIIF